MTITNQHAETTTKPYRRLWAELTNKCQLECVMCYADSGPGGGHGAMGAHDWMGLVDQAAAAKINMMQFIGGEPTLHPRFTQIMSRALGAGLDVEVYSNLVHVTDEMWELFQSPRVSLAFSYFAKDAPAHNAVTGRPSHKATRRNAEKAARLGIPIRAGVIDFGHVQEAVNDLKSIGVTKVATDRVRHIGRGGDSTPAPTELCGRCGQDVAAVSADGDVSPCIFTRWLSAGNVRQTPLADILGSPEMAAALATIPPRTDACDPNTECSPGSPPSSCDPRN
ncbi:MAG: radical SAM protein [Streptosporangiaceae bacterium]|jgi:MoaA/NifB/PqqE/SkfB family radical SAM enzyme